MYKKTHTGKYAQRDRAREKIKIKKIGADLLSSDEITPLSASVRSRYIGVMPSPILNARQR